MTYVEFSKWGGYRHWTYQALRLGEDEHGVWLGASAGLAIDRPDLHLVLEYPSVVLVPYGRPWVAAFNGRTPAPLQTKYEVYIDVSTVPEWDGDRMTAVDLDLDVVRHWDGTVEILDEDEFAEHRVTLDYPPEVVALAQRSAAECLELLRRDAEPFRTVFRSYLAAVERSGVGEQ